MITNYKYVLLILNCKKYQWKREFQKNVWIENIPSNICYLHVIGDQDQFKNTNDYCRIDLSNNILYTNTKDDYNSLPNKVITAIKAVNENFDYQYIYKTDDDQILIYPNFFKELDKTLDVNDYNYGGNIIDIENQYSDYFKYHPELPKNIFLEKTKYCNGRFYFLSKKSVEELLKKEIEISKRYIEDHTIGFYIPDEIKKLYVLDTGKYFVDIESTLDALISKNIDLFN